MSGWCDKSFMCLLPPNPTVAHGAAEALSIPCPGKWGTPLADRQAERTCRSGALQQAEGAEEVTDVADEQVGRFHGWEVAATVELGPVHDAAGVEPGADGGVGGEHGHAGRRSGRYGSGVGCVVGARLVCLLRGDLAPGLHAL